MAKNIKKHVSHLKSMVLNGSAPMLPNAGDLYNGEIAINYADGYETIAIKNSSNNIVRFSSDQYFKKQYIDVLDADKSGNSTHVTVGVKQSDGKVTAVTVSESDIASASAFTSHTANTQAECQHMTSTEKRNLDSLSGNIGTLSAITATSGAINSLTGSVGTMAFENTNSYQKTLTAGSGISISNNVISYTGTPVTIVQTSGYSLTDVMSQSAVTKIILENEEATSRACNQLNDNKQDVLVSGTNIKTINGLSIIGSGNIDVSGGGGGGGISMNDVWDNLATNGNQQIHSSHLSNTLSNYQQTLTAGTGISIIGNVISATGGGGGGGGISITDVWNELSNCTNNNQIASCHLSNALSPYATQSWVTGTALNEYATTGWVNTNYQTTLVSGTNIKTINGQTLLGSGNIDVSGGGGGGGISMNDVWDNLAANGNQQIHVSHLSNALNGNYLPLSGGTLSGNLRINANLYFGPPTDGRIMTDSIYDRIWLLNDNGDIIIGSADNNHYVQFIEDIQGGEANSSDSPYINTLGWSINTAGEATFKKIIRSGGTSSQFLKADGSVDSNTYALASDLDNYLPLTGGTITGDLLVNNKIEIGDFDDYGYGKMWIDSDGLNFSAENTSGEKLYFNTASYFYDIVDIDAKLFVGNSVTAGDGFIKTGYDNTYVLLASGGTKPLSEFGGGISMSDVWDGLAASGGNQIHSSHLNDALGSYATTGWVNTNYQTTLVSGTNIKTINGQSLLGSGDVTLSNYYLPLSGGTVSGTTYFYGRTEIIGNGSNITINTSTGSQSSHGKLSIGTYVNLSAIPGSSDNVLVNEMWVDSQGYVRRKTGLVYTTPVIQCKTNDFTIESGLPIGSMYFCKGIVREGNLRITKSSSELLMVSSSMITTTTVDIGDKSVFVVKVDSTHWVVYLCA